MLNEKVMRDFEKLVDASWKKGVTAKICVTCGMLQPKKNVNNWDNLCDNKKCGSRDLMVVKISDCGKIYDINGTMGFIRKVK